MIKRIGKFYISDELILTHYEVVNQVLSNVVVLEANRQWNGHFEYIAISPLFDVVKDGCKYNEYKVLITDDKIKFEKVE